MKQINERLERIRDEMMAAIRAAEPDIPGEAHAVVVSLDGVMMRMQVETDGTGGRASGFREASCATVSPIGPDGKALESRYVGRLTQSGKRCLKRMVG